MGQNTLFLGSIVHGKQTGKAGYNLSFVKVGVLTLPSGSHTHFYLFQGL